MTQSQAPPAEAAGRRAAARRHFLLRSEDFFEARSPAFVLVIAVVLVGIIAVLDVASGPRLSPSLFYLLPVALVSWRLGRAAGAAIAAGCVGAWVTSDIVSGFYGSDDVAPYWNAFVRFSVLYLVAYLLNTLRQMMMTQRDLATEAVSAADELRELNDVKDVLLHAVSHDLRGPITAIVGSAQSLARRRVLGITDRDQDQLIDAVLQSGHKLNRMVGDLLDLERLDRGVIEPARTSTDLADLLRRAVDEVADGGHPFEVAAEPLEMDVDRGKVERIVDNLVLNAVKHTPLGAPVLVRVTRTEGGALLCVEDRGPGVPDEAKLAIFQPFRQGAAARAAGTGVGIGLSLVSSFAELHGGRAWVEDREGGGSAFNVFLPGEVRPAGPPGPSVSAPSRAAVR